MSKEIWKDIKGYEGLYQVSNLGRVKSLSKEWISGNHKSKNKHEDMILKPRIALGYIHVVLRKNKKAKTYKVHRLVLKEFIGESNLECNHINGNKSDNRIENLAYCTSSENLKHAYKSGLKISMKGEKNPASKLNNEIVKNIRENKFNLTKKEFSLCYNIHISVIRKIINNKTWIHV